MVVDVLWWFGFDYMVSFIGSFVFFYFYLWLQCFVGLIEEVFVELVCCWVFILDYYKLFGVDIGYEVYFGEDVFDGVIFEMFVDVCGGYEFVMINYDLFYFVLQQFDYLEFIDLYYDWINVFYVKDVEFNFDGWQGVYLGYQFWI